MRERTTWNRDQIIKLAAGLKKAEDPRAMNQDHLKQQPAADKYEIGGPSEFAEDVHPSNGTWKAEYSGGEVKRNEIGMPEMRGDTFNHSEKTAAEDEEEKDDDFLEKKADICLHLARRMLPKTASEQALEDQALSFMYMPDAALIDTATRLAAQDDEEDDKEEQSKQAQGQQQDKDDKKQSQGQQDDQEQKKQAQGQQQDKKDQEQKTAQGQQQDDKKQSQGQDDDKKDQEQKTAQDQMAMYSQQACTALQQGDTAAAQQAVQQMVQMSQQQAPQQQQLSQQQAQQQVEQMFAQLMQQGQGQQQQAPQQPTMADDQLLDQMLQQDQQVFATDTAMPSSASAPSMDIQLEGPSMDTSEVKLGSEDEALRALFASNSEVQDAAHAHSLQTGIPVQASAGMTRTASTRTVGTRPTGGVAQLGGGSNGEPSGKGEIDKLAGLWASAPDVTNVFGS